MSKARWVSAIAAAGLSLVALAPAAAQTIKREPIQRIKGVAGSSSFRAYCTPCHGIGGKGDGPAVPALKVPPPDLTLMAARHGGRFPAGAVKRIILGEDTLAAHGSREMPMWGPMFRSVEEKAVTELRVHNLVDYLQSIQAKQ